MVEQADGHVDVADAHKNVRELGIVVGEDDQIAAESTWTLLKLPKDAEVMVMPPMPLRAAVTIIPVLSRWWSKRTDMRTRPTHTRTCES